MGSTCCPSGVLAHKTERSQGLGKVRDHQVHTVARVIGQQALGTIGGRVDDGKW
jgi:hypothetical protein